MFVSFTVAKYSGRNILFGFLSMAIFRILFFLKNYGVVFSKLMGSGKNGTFDIEPDLKQWAYMWVWKSKEHYENFEKKSWVMKYIRRFSTEKFTLFLKPLQSHGLWDGKNPFETNEKENFGDNETIVVLTRASIRIHKAADFWRNVPAIAKNFAQHEGFLYSIGVGEMPFFKQATLSVWQNETFMKAFAYRRKEHSEVIQKTRSQQWYSEELFARFRLMGHAGNVPVSITEF
jgi:hypothetical protein